MPMRMRSTPRACTTAPDVSPPATTIWRAPSPTSPTATAASASSILAPVASVPKRCCTSRTVSGSAVEYTRTGPRGIASRAHAIASRTASLPCATAAASSARAAPPPAMNARTWPRVACEQLPEMIARNPAAGGNCAASGEDTIPQFCGNPIATPDPAVTSAKSFSAVPRRMRSVSETASTIAIDTPSALSASTRRPMATGPCATSV